VRLVGESASVRLAERALELSARARRAMVAARAAMMKEES
jgi:hypothetical protein